jgi:hypothetical protein
LTTFVTLEGLSLCIVSWRNWADYTHNPVNERNRDFSSMIRSASRQWNDTFLRLPQDRAPSVYSDGICGFGGIGGVLGSLQALLSYASKRRGYCWWNRRSDKFVHTCCDWRDFFTHALDARRAHLLLARSLDALFDSGPNQGVRGICSAMARSRPASTWVECNEMLHQPS